VSTAATVLAAIACVERLGGRPLPFAVEVVGFADEEGLRFGTAFLGSNAMAGRFALAWLALTDAEGVTLGDALRAFGGAPEGPIACARWTMTGDRP
jgi:allantoate deiminase